MLEIKTDHNNDMIDLYGLVKKTLSLLQYLI